LELPTAVHALGEVHDTPSSTAAIAPVGLGARWIVHFVPFHLSASGAATRGRPELPTAMHAVGEVHDTPLRELNAAGGFGVGWIVHFVPFHCSATVAATPRRLELPTAVHAVGEVHDTP
jgi:hypothetical protein